MALHRGAALVPLMLVLVILSSSATGWMSFRGDEQNMGSISIDLDPTLLKLDWEYKADGKVMGAVVGYGDRIAFTTVNGSLYVLDAQSGAFVYKRQPTDRFYASPVVIPEEDAIIVTTGNGTIVRYRFSNGELIWSVSLDEEPTVKASPNYSGDSLVITTEGSDVFCIDIDNGSQKWAFGGCGGRAETTPSFFCDDDIDLVMFGACDGYLYALDLITGEMEWNYKAEEIPASPSVYDGKVVVGSFDEYLHCLDAATGERLWKTDLDAPVFSSASVDEKGIAVGTDKGGPILINWTGEVWLSADLGTGIGTSPVLAGENVLATNGNGLFIISRNDGSVLRGFELGNADDQSPSVIDDAIFFGDSDGYVRAISEEKKVDVEPLDIGEEDDPTRDIIVLVVGGLFFIAICVILYLGYKRMRGGDSS